MTSTETTETIISRTETARGTLRDGTVVATMVDATQFDNFIATRVTQGSINAIAYNVPNGGGTHVGANAHGVTAVRVEGNANDSGLTIRVYTESGQALTVDLFGARVDGEYQPITLVVAESTVTA